MKSELTQKHYDEIVIERLDGDDLSVRFFADGRSISDYCITEWQLKAAVKSINIDADNFDRTLDNIIQGLEARLAEYGITHEATLVGFPEFDKPEIDTAYDPLSTEWATEELDENDLV